MEGEAVLGRSRPPEANVASVTLQVSEFLNNQQKFEEVWDGKRLEKEVGTVRAAYKRKGRKGGSYLKKEAPALGAGLTVMRGKSPKDSDEDDDVDNFFEA